MDAALAGEVDAISFAPLNKFAMKLGGLKHEDELHHFAEHLGVTGYFCEFNTLRGLWTSRISSHVPLKDVPKYIEKQRIVDATTLIYRSLQANGIAQPSVAVAGFNPHNGDGGTCGREEIDIIAPAVAELNAQGMPVVGPFPADTIFLRARDGEFDAIVTMYHDQGQIAIKLMGFSAGRHGAGRPAGSDHHAGAWHRLRHCRPGQGQCRCHCQCFRHRRPHGSRHRSP